MREERERGRKHSPINVSEGIQTLLKTSKQHTQANARPETASETHEKRPCVRQESVFKGIAHSKRKMILIIIMYSCCFNPVSRVLLFWNFFEDSSFYTTTDPLKKAPYKLFLTLVLTRFQSVSLCTNHSFESVQTSDLEIIKYK